MPPHHGTDSNSDSAFFPSPHGPSLEGVAALLASPATRNVVVLAGAGISTSASPPIPDFRSPGTGLYSNLAQYNLPYAEAIFDIGYFQRKPQPFFTLAKHLYPGNFKPALAHYFLAQLQARNKLLRVFTQNVDTLERIAGVSEERIVEAHGSFATSTCIACKHRVDPEWIRTKVEKGEVARCPRSKCPGRKRGEGGLVKPDIVFFGESLPSRFFRCIPDLKKADLLIVMGTSLQVQPFASLIDAVPADCPRVLLNLEKVGEIASSDGYAGGSMGGTMFAESGFDFDGLAYGGRRSTRDVFWQGKADDAVQRLTQLMGKEWHEELQSLKAEGHRSLDDAKPSRTEAEEPEQSKPPPNEVRAADKAVTEPDEVDQLAADLESKAKLKPELKPEREPDPSSTNDSNKE
ncbi:hypothetical protein PaG_04631 [Moesziomyces aphidis]|uniref:NAD-dependent protein deacetylase n=1 Tax=Moesziomyces aphidis TaxID=84754 RepID=W3VGG7_MOEAP|nr:hypothetical protein PaG_04631 [Moesziomyces aphidis]